MIPPAELKALEEALDAIESPGVRLVCLRCAAELPGSDPAGGCVRLGLCQPACLPNDGPAFGLKFP
jgi:hypothetical protein